MKVFATVLLIFALLPLLHLLFARRRPAPPGPRYPRLLRQHWLRFGMPPVLLLGATGRLDAFVALPHVFVPAAAALGVDGFGRAERWYLIGSAWIGIAIGVAAGALLSGWRAWRGRPEGTLFGDAAAVRPREGELGWAAAVAVTAGVTEEAYFRLLLPLLATQAFGNAVAAFAVSALLFGAAHRYQGWRGVIATGLAGTALTMAYLATGSLLATMAFHAAGDLGHLVLRPAVRGWVERRRHA